MPNFYFQQRAGRTSKRGQHWLDGVSAIPIEWLNELDTALAKAGIVPNSGKTIHYRGGIYISPVEHIVAVFSFCPTPQGYKDYNGRLDGVVLNVLFSKTDNISAVKSLKKVWDHPALKSSPQETAMEQFFIQLDENMGESIAEKSFFKQAAVHYKDSVLISYSDEGEQPKITTLSESLPGDEEKTITKQKKSFEHIQENHQKGFFMRYQFIWGFIAGIALTAGCFVYFKLSKTQVISEIQKPLLELPLKQIAENPNGYRLPLVIKITGDGEEKRIEVLLSPDDNASGEK